jgi:hypothetical protein
VPRDLKPEYNAQDKFYRFPNGSLVRFKGVNGEKHERLRGGATDLIVIDECGIMTDLAYIVKSVLFPMTQTTKGRLLFATTPPRTPDHDSATIYEELKDAGATVEFTLLDNVRIDEEEKFLALRESGEKADDIPAILAGQMLPKTTTAQREYFCLFATDAETRVLPEWDEQAKRECVKVVTPPPYFDAYVALDPGFNDRAGILYAFWDFRRAKLCIQKDRLLHMASTLTIADHLKQDEHDLWGDRRPHKRISDVDPRLLKDLWEQHGLHFIQADKQESLAAINRRAHADSAARNRNRPVLRRADPSRGPGRCGTARQLTSHGRTRGTSTSWRRSSTSSGCSIGTTTPTPTTTGRRATGAISSRRSSPDACGRTRRASG